MIGFRLWQDDGTFWMELHDFVSQKKGLACVVYSHGFGLGGVGAQRELDRLRQRSFPSFAHAARNRLAVPPDEII